MFKLIIFGFLFYIFGNPITAILVLLLIVYVLDRRFVGVFPSVTKPFKRARAISKLRRQIAVSQRRIVPARACQAAAGAPQVWRP